LASIEQYLALSRERTLSRVENDTEKEVNHENDRLQKNENENRAKSVDPFRRTTVQLLEALESTINKEIFANNVDYFSLHIRCWQLLLKLFERLS
jgi:hypothetical protein